LWADEVKGKSLFFLAIHMSQVWIDVDFRGQVDTVHRKMELTARQAAELVGKDALSPKMAEAYADPKKIDSAKFEILHVIRPNEQLDTGKYDYRGKAIASRYIAIAEKFILQRGGYFTMPIAVSRNTTAPSQKYGSSPMFKVMGTSQGLNEIAKTILRAGHKAVDPPLAFFDDGDISKLVTKPGGSNPGLVEARAGCWCSRSPAAAITCSAAISRRASARW
jgi:hypothetical protein